MDKIIIEKYSEEWPIIFKKLGQSIRNELGEIALRIDHIGSTSIPNMSAKPIIDLQISVTQLEPTDPYRIPLEKIGYVFREKNPDKTKRYFRESSGDKRTQIHVRKIGSWHQQFPLLFRDYLRQNVVDAKLYESEKYRLARIYSENRVAYVEAKNKIIWEIMFRADRWASEIGWNDGDSDI